MKLLENGTLATVSGGMRCKLCILLDDGKQRNQFEPAEMNNRILLSKQDEQRNRFEPAEMKVTLLLV